ncbi:hypothetical protein [Thiorhodospira sibirica]|uniref:hypothetical protein n=1 Tax=Thiorhodospira sibirica TaxID=154347 RepID=UPI00022C1170|nr:hypothetical protein [Thiorhodospira sibirica]
MIKALKTQLNPWFERVNARSLRERVLILAVVLGLLLFIVDTYIWLPNRNAITAQKQAIQRLTIESTRLQARYESLEREAAYDPNTGLRERIAQLEPEIAGIREALSKHVAQLISPTQMNTVLRALVGTNEGLQLISLQSLPPAEIILGPSDPAETQHPPEHALRVYRRGVDLELQGSYHALIAYLDMLADLPWVLGWDWLNVAGDDYPVGTFRLRLYTLSIDQEWLRV